MLSLRLIRAFTSSALSGRPFVIPATCCHAATFPYQETIYPHSNRSLSQSRWSSSSSKRWQARQSRDKFSREAKVQGLKSRAAFKLLEVGLELFYAEKTG